MKKSKKILAYVLLLAMVFSLVPAFSIPASAAVKPGDVIDWDDVEFPNAVEIMMALGVLTGYPEADGKVSFQNDKTLTRAELSIVVAKILNGGVEPVLDKNARPDFSDVPSPDYDWAAPYIFYCVQQGILSGDSGAGGTFRPGDDVTVVEATKCILVAIGYRADLAGFIGPNWITSVTVAANSCDPKLFSGLTDIDVSDPLKRGDFSQVTFNAAQTDMKKYEGNTLVDYKIEDISNSKSWTMLSRFFGVESVTGIVLANEFGGVSSNIDLKALQPGTTNVNGMTYDFSSGEDMLGLEVNVLTKEVDNDIVVLGVATTANNNVLEVANGAVINTSARQSGITVPANLAINLNYLPKYFKDNLGDLYTADLLSYVNDTMTRSGNISSAYRFDNMIRPSGIRMRIVDNNNDGTADFIFVTEPTLDIVTGVSGAGRFEFGTLPAVEADKLVTDLELKRGDIVLVTNVEGRAIVTKPETVSGKISNVSNNNKRIVVDGDTLNVSDVYSEYAPRNLGFTRASEKFISGETYNPALTYTFYLDADENVILFHTPPRIIEDAPPYVPPAPTPDPSGYMVITSWVQDQDNYENFLVTGCLADGIEGEFVVNSGKSDEAALYLVVEESGGAPVLVKYTKDSQGELAIKDAMLIAHDDDNDYGAIAAGTLSFNGAIAPGTVHFTGDSTDTPEDAAIADGSFVFYVELNTVPSYTITGVQTGATAVDEVDESLTPNVYALLNADGTVAAMAIVTFD